ncbi:DNA circularization protein [Enterobacter mori]|uniref:DNA circularization protein n=1 Tax=Enterobacter mori TaxID=539813 RepID=UPI003B83C063
MGWAENLQTASFRGVTFDVTATDEQVSRDHAVYEYPHVDGADLKDLGRKARPYRLTAFLWGDHYEYDLQTLTAVLDTPGTGELIHPVYGSIPSVIVTGYSVRHEAESPDSCTVELNFLESGLGTGLFTTALPEIFGASVFDRLDAMTEDLAKFLDSVLAPLKTLNSLIKRASTVKSTLMNTLLVFVDYVKFTADQIRGLSENPGECVLALGGALEVYSSVLGGAIPALSSSAPVTVVGAQSAAPEPASSSTVLSCWTEIVTEMDKLVALPVAFINGDVTPTIPVPSGAKASDVQDITVAWSVLAVTELASVATAILADDAQTSVMTPDDIEKLINDARTRIQSTIDRLRDRYEPVRTLVTATAEPVGIQWLGLVDHLRETGLALQNLGVMVLARRPPLTRRRVDVDTCLRLLAHAWYADHSRATELLRLNPQVRDPNLITAGMVLNAYAK